MTTQDLHREAFEKWATAQGLDLGCILYEDDYFFDDTRRAWRVWKAAMRYRDELENGNGK